MLLFTPMNEAGGAAGPGAATLADGPAAVMARIRGGAGGEAALWSWAGTVFGRRPGEVARPLLQVSGRGFSRITRGADGAWELGMSDIDLDGLEGLCKDLHQSFS